MSRFKFIWMILGVLFVIVGIYLVFKKNSLCISVLAFGTCFLLTFIKNKLLLTIAILINSIIILLLGWIVMENQWNLIH